MTYQPVPYTPSARSYRHVPTSSLSIPGRPASSGSTLPDRHRFHPKQILAESTTQEKRWFAGLAVLVGILLLWLTIGPAVLKHAHVKSQEAKLNANLAEADALASASALASSTSSSSPNVESASPTMVTASSTFEPSSLPDTVSTTTQLAVAVTITSGTSLGTVAPIVAVSSISTHPWQPLKGIFASPSGQPPVPSRRINRPTTKPFEPPRPTVRAPWAKIGPMRMAVESARSASHAAAETGGVWVPDGRIKYADPVAVNVTKQAAPSVELLARRWKSRKG